MAVIHNLNTGQDSADMGNELYHTLMRAGLIFPDNEEDLEHFIELAKKETATIPPEMDNPGLILSGGLLRLASTLNNSENEAIEENLAQAAREGGEIPPDVIKVMEEDRKHSEKQDGDE